ncbi:DUF1045 domain-containing protein [Marinovum sp.]|uniref:DUF1045 domain-containing protein n=1 Tax=Marinovum sp. TaxID=2024839 RepID=UPI002B2693BB|nr:DUF1045 domain-containing protein [Marinovum sp.]
MSYSRFAIYYLPSEGALARFGAQWLGWDVAQGTEVAQPDLPAMAEVTATPRKYGFHATLKPPFRLAEGCDPAGLQAAVAEMAAGCPPALTEGLEPARLGSFLALVPKGDTAGIARVAATCVSALDRFRAPPAEGELTRRRKARLSERQEALLLRWGYPYVMEEFRFHLTLTGRLPRKAVAQWQAHVTAHLPPLPAPFVLDAVALVGERADGRFELVQRYDLGG